MPRRRNRSDFEYKVASYDAPVLRVLKIQNEDVPTDAIGVEIEMTYGDAVQHVTEGVARTIGRDYASHILGKSSARDLATDIILDSTREILGDENMRGVAKWDGSIGNGFEIATEPLPFSRIESIAHCYGKLLEIGKPTLRCGLHAHIHRKAFLFTEALQAWAWLWSRKQVVLVLSGRSVKRLERWANPEYTSKIWYGTYPMRSNGYDVWRGVLSEHHSSVCFRHKHTAELRVFAAPTTELLAHQRLQLILATVNYARSRAIGSTVSWREFFAWLEKRKDIYPFAAAYVRRRRKKLLAADDVHIKHYIEEIPSGESNNADESYDNDDGEYESNDDD